MQKTLRLVVVDHAGRDAGWISQEFNHGGIAHAAKLAFDKESFSAALKEFRPDVVLARHDNAACNGREALAAARDTGPDVPVIIILDTLENGLGGKFIELGAADYILEHQTSELVATVVRAVREAEERKQRRRAETLLELKYQQLTLQNEALQQSEERFRQLAESIREVFWMTDKTREQMLYISPAYEEIWGRSCGDLYASPRDWLAAVHPEDRDRVTQAVFSGGAPEQYDQEFRIVRPDNSLRWIRDRAFPVRDESGAIYRIAGVAEDITNRKRLEQQILEISDREQERIGRDLHDELCQLLVSIGFNANALRQDLRSAPEAAAAERIGGKISQAIKMARELAHGLCPLEFRGENLAGALEGLARSASEDYHILCHAECDPAGCVTDPKAATHVYRIAREAVHNAVKHGKPRRVGIALGGGDGKILLTVLDDGVGMPERLPAGTGIGLEMMKYRAGMLRGALEIRARGAREGGGTVVTCSFPQPAAL